MAARIQLKRDNAANWTVNNPILLPGEPGFEVDTNKLKLGNGVSRWNDLSYITDGIQIDQSAQYILDNPNNVFYGDGSNLTTDTTTPYEILLKSPNDTQYKIHVDDSGVLMTSLV